MVHLLQAVLHDSEVDLKELPALWRVGRSHVRIVQLEYTPFPVGPELSFMCEEGADNLKHIKCANNDAQTGSVADMERC